MTDDDKALVEAMKDAVLHGAGFLKNGKHVPIDDVYLDPRDARIEALIAENERLQRSAEYWEQDAKRYAANQEYWRMEERAAIVAYLRIKRGAMQHIADDLANVIEAGEHLKCTASPEA